MSKSDPLRCKHVINVIINCNKWDKEQNFYQHKFERVFLLTIGELNLAKNVQFEISVNLTNDEELHNLNNTFRGIDKPTNVLTFPAEEFTKDSCDQFKESKEVYLGDIAISFERTEQEANELGLSFDDHLAHLIVHSILHIFGYDHINDDEAWEMENLEKKVLEKMDIADPYNLVVENVK